MSLLKLTNFGGELPRVKPRGLPDGAAQRYENLLATSADLNHCPPYLGSFAPARMASTQWIAARTASSSVNPRPLAYSAFTS